MSKISFLRHDGWVGPSDLSAQTLNIIGCGAVGSHAAVLAVRMGFHKIRLWDNDTVESHNIANQAFLSSQIGEQKTTALADLLKQINPDVMVQTVNRFFTSELDSDISGPIIIAVDSITARRDIYKVFLMNPMIPVISEIRLGFDSGEIHVINPLNKNECQAWFDSLVDEDKIAESPCNLRICTTLVQLAVSQSVHAVCNYFAAQRHSYKFDYVPRTVMYFKQKLKLMQLQ